MSETIQAWQIGLYGGPNQLTAVERPFPQAGKGQIIVRVRASGVTRADGMMRAGTPRFARLFLGLKRPRNDLIGTCFSGEIVGLGPETTRFAIGDMVFGEAGLSFGANASHLCLDEAGVVMPKPKGLSHEEAAVICDGPLTSLNFLRNLAELKKGERVLILGASGSLGSAAVQIASAMGADVTGTCSARNAGLVASLGATRVIDYNREDFTKERARYDVIYDTLGVSSFRAAKHVLTRQGRYVCPVLGLSLLGAMLGTSLLGQRKARFAATGMMKPDALQNMLADLIALHDQGLMSPVMDRTYPLDRLVEAHEYKDTGHSRGNVVVV